MIDFAWRPTRTGAAALLLAAAIGCAGAQFQLTGDVVGDVRLALDQQDVDGAARIVATYRAARGMTPEVLVGLSWLGRGAATAGDWDDAERYAEQTRLLALEALTTRGLDDEPHLPIALGAAFEVLARVMVERGARSEAVHGLEQALDTYQATSIATRIQKNINLLNLEGQPAPILDLTEHLGPTPPTLSALEGQVVLLFFWAHWCADCKLQAPILARLLARHGDQGLRVLAPTQRYGYVAGGRLAPAEEETQYIKEVLATSYDVLSDQPIPLSDANHRRYGVSTTPTLVLVDREGAVRLYHPGRMSEAELDPLIRGLLAQGRQ